MQIDHLDSQRECKHAGCNCRVSTDQDFCCEQCRKAARNVATHEAEPMACACGHAECADSKLSDPRQSRGLIR